VEASHSFFQSSLKKIATMAHRNDRAVRLEEPTITLQLARLRDVNEIARMSAALIEHGLPPAWTVARVSRQLKHRDSVTVVARTATQLVGFAIMQVGDDKAHLTLLAVLPTARRRGVASKLLTWLHETAMAAGVFVVNLELRAENAQARRFYLSMGYEECGYVRGYYSNIEDAVRMRRDLTVKS
jgi:ribosomal-protein-alanine N-acetyltransferase